jgi:hypothetical protein
LLAFPRVLDNAPAPVILGKKEDAVLVWRLAHRFTAEMGGTCGKKETGVSP